METVMVTVYVGHCECERALECAANVVIGMSGQVRASRRSSGGTGGGSSSSGRCW